MNVNLSEVEMFPKDHQFKNPEVQKNKNVETGEYVHGKK